MPIAGIFLFILVYIYSKVLGSILLPTFLHKAEFWAFYFWKFQICPQKMLIRKTAIHFIFLLLSKGKATHFSQLLTPLVLISH